MVLGPEFLVAGNMSHFRHALSNCTHFRAYGSFWLSSVQGAQRVADEKKTIEE